MRLFRLVLLCALAFAAGLSPATAQIDTRPKVHVRLVAEQGEITPGGTVAVAFEQDIRPGWHTYWRNPGDAGAATELHWQLPPGWTAGPLEWPYPRRLPVGPLMDYGYEGHVWILTTLHAPANAAPGAQLTLTAKGNWLVCKEVCVPEDGTMTLPLTVAAHPVPPTAAQKAQFAAARAKLPQASPWPIVYRAEGKRLDLYVRAPALAKARPAQADFFPVQSGVITGTAPQTLGFADNGLVLRLSPQAKFADGKGGRNLSGVLVLTSADGSVQALSVQALPGAVPKAQFESRKPALGLAFALLFAFLGGLILNLMPCVLPVLAMKAIAIASAAGAHPREAAREGFAYGIGAILSFLALGTLIAVLRTTGEAVGWGFQLQQPVIVAGFALLMFAVGLNLSGAYELSGGFSAGESLTRRGGVLGAFFTGVLAVAVAAPCTAPFMAAALGYALTQPAGMALAVFFVLGLGFVAPFVAIGVSPGLLRLLPKPGPWMLRFKQLLAFPMYGAAVWLVWVLALQAGAGAVLAALAAMVVFALAAWLWNTTRGAAVRWRAAGNLLALIAFVLSLAALWFVRAGSSPATAAQMEAASSIPNEPYSAARLSALRGQNRPVFVNATAAWCITCLVNERVAFSSETVRNAFAKKNVAYLVADWTNRDPAITALLQAHQRSGVPLYLYYAPGAADAVVLPQILTPDEIVSVVGR